MPDTPRKGLRRLFISSLIGAVWLFLFSLCEAVEVVTHKGVEVDTLSRGQLSSIFQMRLRQWPDGQSVRVFVFADDNPIHREFCKTYLNVYPHQLRRRLNRRIFSGTGQEPNTVYSMKEMRQRVSSVPGAIGYIDALSEQDTGLSRLKIDE